MFMRQSDIFSTQYDISTCVDCGLEASPSLLKKTHCSIIQITIY